MASSQISSKGSTTARDKGKKGSEEGKVYEKLSLALLAKNGYELSKHNSKFCDFAIGREVGLGTDGKFDDNVFRYTDNDNTKQLIFVQIKHKQHDHPINSAALSAEAATSKGGGDGGMRRDFNLQKYFISFLNVREELKKKSLSEECRNGNIQYVSIFTNVGLDKEELISKGFSFKAAPDDIIKLFTLTTQEPNSCYQLTKISEGLRNILMKSSDLHRVARELAQYVVWENYRENKIMGIDTTPIKQYHVPLARDVIRKSYQVESISSRKKTKNEPCCEVQFRDEFLENDDTGPKQLRDAVFEAIRELDESRKSLSDEELKKHLTRIKWKAVPNFGKTKKNKDMILPCEWTTLKEEDITDFLKCLVFAVNRPRVNKLRSLFLCSVQDTVVDRHYSIPLKEIVDKLQNVGPELRERIEQDLGIYETTSFEEKWTSGDKIVKFLDDQKQQIGVSFFVTAMTLIYESEVMQFGKFKKSEKIQKCLDIFFLNSAKILCVNTPQTLLSSIKILQYLNSKKDYFAEEGRICTKFDRLKSKENRDSVVKAFELERNILLVIEHRHTTNEQDVEEFYKTLYTVVNAKPNKKIILIIPQEEHNYLLQNFKNDSHNKDDFMLEYDLKDIRYFEPKEDPFKKEVIIFQGQDKRVSLSDIAGIDSWNSYVQSLSQGTSEQCVIDGMTLVKILSNEEMEVGSKPAGTSSLEDAYTQMYEEINVETLINKIMSQEHDNNANDMYIVSGITGSSEEEKTGKMFGCLGQDYENEEFKNRFEEFKNRLKIIGVSNLKVAGDEFNYSNFKDICHIYPAKRIFWISIKCENGVTKFILQGIYNCKFYLKRKFKNVIIKKDLKEHLIKEDLSDTFIFYCAEGDKELYDSMNLNAREIEQFKNSCMIKIRFQKSDAEADFKSFKKNETVHFLEFKQKRFFWCESHGSVKTLQRYIDHEQCETSLVEEDNFIRKIKDRKVVIFADDPGMGKTTTLIKLYETEIGSSSIIKSHWVIRIKLRDHLEAVGDLEGDISIVSVVHFLSKIYPKLNNNLAKNVLKNSLDKSENFHAKPLLLVFDGFDEVLDEDDRHRILKLLKFIKNKTEAKLWVTTRCHFKTLLEEELSSIAIQFSPMDDTQQAQYITTYLQHRLYLILNDGKYSELFGTYDEKGNNEKIHMYTEAFIKKMKLIFRGDIATFIGTPLQLYLLLEDSVGDLKNWIEKVGYQIPDLKYFGNDVCEIYENFIKRKYDVYFLKRGYQERVQQKYEKLNLDKYHKKFAVSKMQEKSDDDFEVFKDVFLLVGIIKSQGCDLEFSHKTFEEFFAAKMFFDWIKKVQEAHKREYLLKVILLKTGYQLVRTFMNIQLQNLLEEVTKDGRQNELDKSLGYYGKTAEKLLNEENSPLIEEIGTPLHVAVKEGNKVIACCLLKILQGHPDVLKKFLFIPDKYEYTALHLACRRDDVEIVNVLLHAAAEISEDTLQEFLKFGKRGNALKEAVNVNSCIGINNIHICNELLNRANNKLDLILTRQSALFIACSCKNENIVEFLLQKFKDEKHNLRQLLLYQDEHGNVLGYAGDSTIIEKLICAAKSIKDGNETLKSMLLPEEGYLPFNKAISLGNKIVVEKLLNVAKEVEDDDDTLKQLLFNVRSGGSVLHVAVIWGRVDIIKLLLETAADLGVEILEKLLTAVDKKGKNAIQLIVEGDHENIFADFFKMLEKDKYSDIRKRVMEIFDNLSLESKVFLDMEKLIIEFEHENIKKVKDILSDAKNSCVSHNESLRILLLAEVLKRRSILWSASLQGNSEIIKQLISYAKEIGDDNYTLKQLLLDERSGETLLHVAVRWGCGDTIKVLLETAADLGIEILEKLIFAVDINGKNVVHLMIEHENGTFFADSFKILDEDKYQNIREKVKKIRPYFDPLDPVLRFREQRLIIAIRRNNLKQVKDILSEAKNSHVYSSVKLRYLLLSNFYMGINSLHTACNTGNLEIIKELLFYAMSIDDGGATLKELITRSFYGNTPFQVLKHGYTTEIQKTVGDLILEASNNNREYAVNILEEINKQYAEVKPF